MIAAHTILHSLVLSIAARKAAFWRSPEDMVGRFWSPSQETRTAMHIQAGYSHTRSSGHISRYSETSPFGSSVAQWISLKPDQQTVWQNAYLAQLFEFDPNIHQAQELVQAFGNLLRQRQGDCLDVWLKPVE